LNTGTWWGRDDAALGIGRVGRDDRKTGSPLWHDRRLGMSAPHDELEAGRDVGRLGEGQQPLAGHDGEGQYQNDDSDTDDDGREWDDDPPGSERGEKLNQKEERDDCLGDYGDLQPLLL